MELTALVLLSCIYLRIFLFLAKPELYCFWLQKKDLAVVQKPVYRPCRIGRPQSDIHACDPDHTFI